MWVLDPRFRVAHENSSQVDRASLKWMCSSETNKNKIGCHCYSTFYNAFSIFQSNLPHWNSLAIFHASIKDIQPHLVFLEAVSYFLLKTNGNKHFVLSEKCMRWNGRENKQFVVKSQYPELGQRCMKTWINLYHIIKNLKYILS